MELVFDLYTNNLKDIIDGNIYDKVPNKKNLLQLSKQNL